MEMLTCTCSTFICRAVLFWRGGWRNGLLPTTRRSFNYDWIRARSACTLGKSSSIATTRPLGLLPFRFKDQCCKHPETGHEHPVLDRMPEYLLSSRPVFLLRSNNHPV